MLQDVPHREILDLSLIYYVLLDASEKGTTAMLISDRHMDQWKTTEKKYSGVKRTGIQGGCLWQSALQCSMP